MFSDMSNSIPGVDEAMSFAELMKMVQNMNFSCIVFDTAPTGHTLRLLSFPTIMDKALTKLMDLKNKFSGLFSQFGSMFGAGGVRRGSTLDELAARLSICVWQALVVRYSATGLPALLYDAVRAARSRNSVASSRLFFG